MNIWITGIVGLCIAATLYRVNDLSEKGWLVKNAEASMVSKESFSAEIVSSDAPSHRVLPEPPRDNELRFTSDGHASLLARAREEVVSRSPTMLNSHFDSDRVEYCKNLPQRDRVEHAIRRAAPPDKWHALFLLACCESELDERAINSTAKDGIDLGIVQINTYWQRDVIVELGLKRSELFNLENNFRVANRRHEIDGDWSDWYLTKHCHGLE